MQECTGLLTKMQEETGRMTAKNRASGLAIGNCSNSKGSSLPPAVTGGTVDRRAEGFVEEDMKGRRGVMATKRGAGPRLQVPSQPRRSEGTEGRRRFDAQRRTS